MSEQEPNIPLTGIAIIGMSGRFPGANNIDAFWQNLSSGVESVAFFTDEQALASGISPAQLHDPQYVKARAIFEGAELFDADFFGYNPREAAIMDPQQRLFLECAWEALEHAGYDAASYTGLIGVYGGASMNTYLLSNLYPNRDLIGLVGDFQAMIGNDKDYLTTRVSYKLDLKGPSVAVQTACSTSLVAVGTACQSLLQYQCDLALAGGSSIGVPQRAGYLYQEGGIGSPDGHCRAFDAEAGGTVGGDGVGVVVLKRLDDALADGDTIHAIITGFAINNDGAAKAGYTAPSSAGQAHAIAAAQAMAEVDPETISYIETHGTATPLGDPIEIAALNQVFRAGTDKTGFCAIGSVKTNIGHLNAAAGVASLIKTVLALEHKRIPPSLHFRSPNPQIDFANSAFYVNTRLTVWPASDTPRRAGVSSFGIGGTNAHVVLEEAPAAEASGASRPYQLLLLSARTPSALEAATDQLAAYVEQHQNVSLADVVYTLQVGRHAFSHRRMLLCRDLDDARRALTDRGRLLTRFQDDQGRPVVFLFPGGGAQYAEMAADLYWGEPVFREQIDQCADLLQPHLGCDIREIMYPKTQDERRTTNDAGHDSSIVHRLSSEDNPALTQPGLALPALFAVEYALAQLWMAWGLRPQALIGHSLGEYVAACLAGVFSLADALALVALRGRLMQQLPPGAMLSVSAAPEMIEPLLGPHLALAAINGPALCVVSGPAEAISRLAATLGERGLEARQLHIDVAAHSALVESILETFTTFIKTLSLRTPQIPYISNVTGTWITAAEATDPGYWARHLRQTVRFAEGLRTLLADPSRVLLEVGPGQTLTTLARLQATPDRIILASMRHPNDQQPDDAFALGTLGQLWLAGVQVDWPKFYSHERRRRLPLPTYPFERQRYWIDPPKVGQDTPGQAEPLLVSVPTPAAAPPIVWERAGLHARPQLPNDYIAPRDAVERLIAGVWQELLGIEPVGVADNFFALGGHSLLASQIVARVRENYRVELPLRALFEAPTVAGLSERVGLAGRDTPPLAELPIRPIPREGSLPLSFAQQRLWFIDQLAGGISAYNMPAAVQLSGQLDRAALEQSFAEVVRRHEILRTTFAVVDGQPVQVIDPVQVGLLPLLDLRALPAQERATELQRLATAEAQQPFDLMRGPLLRATLLRLAADEHVLLLTMHHIIADAWSIGVLIRELTLLYSAFSAREPSPLAELSIQYADFAHWQRQWLQGALLDEQLVYWRAQLAEAPVLQLPTDRPRPPIATFRGTNQAFTLPLELAERLRAVSQQEGCTLFMLLLAAFKTLLSRYSGQDDIVVSSGVANRRRPELELLIGCFINILVLRTDLAGRPSFRELLRRVREVCLGAYAHQDLPFELLVEQLHPERDLSYNPLAQVMFIVQNAPLDLTQIAGLTVQPINLFERAAAQFDLTMHIWEQPDGLRGLVEYNTDLFDAATIIRMLGAFQTLLEAIMAAPDQPISALPLLPAAEQQRILVEWNATRTAFPHDRCLHELFEANVLREPDAIALILDEKTTGVEARYIMPVPPSAAGAAPSALHLTYRALNERANQLAQHLRALGVGPDVPVGLHIARSAEMVIGILGILKAGGAFVPLDPNYPRERLAAMLDDAHVPVLLTQHRIDDVQLTIDDLGAADTPVVNRTSKIVHLDADWPLIAQESRANPDCQMSAEHLAYVIYTSGSTGRPKGIAIRHRGVVNNITDINQRFDVGPADSVLALSSLSFDLCVYEVLGTLAAGAMIVMPTARAAREPDCWATLLVRYQVTVWNSAPPLLKILVDHVVDQSRLHPRWLRLAILGGDWVPVALPDQLKALAPAVRVISLGGATEASIHSTIYPVEVSYAGWRSIPYGQPMANQRIYVLDANMQPVPIGVPGELYLGGVGLARGYFNRPDLTAERFVPNPFVTPEDERRTTNDESAARPGVRPPASCVRLYRTGDMVRWLPDGNTELLGRTDHLVKIRGFRIELGEIKAVLERHTAVREAVVAVREHLAGGKQLVAYVVPAEDERRTQDESAPSSAVLRPSSLVSELRAFMTERLPEYMLPAVLVLLDALPLSANGKVDRQALPLPALEAVEQEPLSAAPRTAIEELLSGIWADVLEVEHVGIHDNFFDLGGHSLLATQVLSRVRAALQVTLSLRELFEAPTVAGIAERIASARQAQQGWKLPPLVPRARAGVIPLSFAQQRLWFLDQLQPNSPFYNVPAAVRLSGPLDLSALDQALGGLVRRHEALRTSFVEVDGQPRQVVAQAGAALPLTLTDLRTLPADEREQAARRLAEIEARRPFNLARGPLLRAILLCLDDQEHVLVLTLHHIIADGWSLGILIREFALLYQAHSALSAGAPAPLAGLPVQYADYAIWQRQWLRGAALDAQLDYWRQRLAGAPPIVELPTDRPRPLAQTFAGASYTFTLPAQLSAALTVFSRRAGCTLFMTLLAAFQSILAGYSRQDDIVVGTAIAGRTQPETEGVLGCFVNTLVLRGDLAGNPTFHEVARRTREVCLEAYAHQDLPIELLVEALQPQRDLSRNPLFQVLFVLQNAPMPALDLPDLSMRPLELTSGTARLDLALSMTETAGGLVGTLEYNTDLFDCTTIMRLSSHIQMLLAGAIIAPDQPIAAVPLLSNAERQHLLMEWRAPAADHPQHLCAHQLFEAQAQRTPDAIAVVFDFRDHETTRPRDQNPTGRTTNNGSAFSLQLTYAELNARANRLAHYLRARGVGPEVPVGLCLERSVELVVGFLGILKAGGVCVPLDPDYPAERLAFMLEDAQVEVLITSIYDLRLTIDDLEASQIPIVNRTSKIINLCADWPAIAQQETTAPARGTAPGNLAYVIYTSGSTGRPKGVQVAHRQLINTLLATQELFGFSAQDVVPCSASFAFDIALFEILSPLFVGGTALMLTKQQVLDLPALMRVIERVTFLHMLPSLMRQFVGFVAEQAPAGGGPARYSNARRVFVGGDRVSPELIQAMQKCFPAAQIFIGYGPTETTIITSLYAVAAGQRLQHAIMGRPLRNTLMYICDRHQRLVPIGVPGEVFIGGAGVARGYLNRPDLTAERFVPDPFGETNDERRTTNDTSDTVAPAGVLGRSSCVRLYRTGDLARYLPDGTIAFLGRTDQQIKLRGFRVELGEIEALLRQHPAVRDAVTLLREDRLVAYVVPTADEGRRTNDEEAHSSLVRRPSSLIPELRTFLAKRLPDYMLPSVFVALDAIPLSPNGKVDRRALPVPSTARPELADAFVAPRTPIEEQMSRIWTAVLGIERIGVYDNFFELGGHSLLAVQVISRARSAFRADLALRTLFETPTVAGLVAALSQSLVDYDELEDDIPLIARGGRSLDQLVAELEQLPAEAIRSIMTNEQRKDDIPDLKDAS
jgi:amino acid adenylation domain-containing protein